jgi:hypothetical protein
MRPDTPRISLSTSRSSSRWLRSTVLCDLRSCLTSSNLLNFLRPVIESCIVLIHGLIMPHLRSFGSQMTKIVKVVPNQTTDACQYTRSSFIFLSPVIVGCPFPQKFSCYLSVGRTETTREEEWGKAGRQSARQNFRAAQGNRTLPNAPKLKRRLAKSLLECSFDYSSYLNTRILAYWPSDRRDVILYQQITVLHRAHPLSIEQVKSGRLRRSTTALAAGSCNLSLPPQYGQLTAVYSCGSKTSVSGPITARVLTGRNVLGTESTWT